MKIKVAFKGYFRELQYEYIEYSSIDDFNTKISKLIGTKEVTRLEMLYLPIDVYVLLDSTPFRVPNSLGLRSNLVFVRESEDGKELQNLEDEDFEVIKVLIEDKAFQEYYTLKGIDYYEVILDRMSENK